MAWNEEGGVRTKKIISAIAVLALIFTAGALLMDDSSSVEGATAVINGETDIVKTKGELSYTIMFYESEEFETLEIKYSAVLMDSSGEKQSNAVSPSSGTLTNGVDTKLVITAPSVAGRYTLSVTFTEIIDNGDKTETEKIQIITVKEPIVLSVVLNNNSNVDFTDFAVYFYVDGVFVEGSRTLTSVKAGESTTVTHEWVAESLSNGEHKFKVVAGDENVGGTGSISGGEGTFYVGHTDYGIVNILIGILFVVLLIVVIWLYRKPVKNYGKPKSRR